MPSGRPELAGWFQVAFQISCLRACGLAHFNRAEWYRRSQARDQTALRLRIRELAHARPRFGVLRIWVLLRREGWLVNRTRVRRLYALANGQKLRVLIVLDAYTRECLALEAAVHFRGQDVARVLTAVGMLPGLSTVINCDNGTEFTSRAFDHWASANQVRLDFSRPANRPTTR